jgi:hypothetical protein
MAPMSPEAKAALMARLAAGRTKHKKMRDEAKAKGLPDPKPRKSRKKATTDTAEALANPVAIKPDNDTVRGIDAAPPAAVNAVAAAPVAPAPRDTAMIDVPNLPEKSKRKKIVKDAEKEPVPKEEKGLSTTGKPAKINDNNLIVNEETGNQVITTMMPGQKESIKKVLTKNKKLDPVAPVSNPTPSDKTVDNVKTHVPDVKAVQGRAPFSMSAVRKILYQ